MPYEFNMQVTAKPVGGVSEVDIPAELAEALTKHVPAVLKDKDHELTLTAKDAKEASLLAGYSRAWGARQTPKLYIKKIPNRRGMAENIARLDVRLDSEVPAENRAGRKERGN